MKKHLRRALPWAVLALCYLLTVGVMALWGTHNINADMSSEMVLAQLLNEEGALLSENWYYSTELRVVSPVPVYQLALRIFPNNWHAARTFTVAVMLALVAASFIYMGRGAGLRDSAVYAAGLILLPVSEVHRFLFSLGLFYTAYIVFGCLMTGLTLRMNRRRGRALRLALLLVLGTISGLSGVRMPMICGVPLLLACAVEGFAALRRASSLREALTSEESVSLLGACVCMTGMLAGFLVNTRVFSRIYSFTDYGETMLKQFDLSVFGGQMNKVFDFFGLNTGVPFFSPGAIVDMAMVAVCVLMLLALAIMLLRRGGMSAQERLLVDVALLAVLLGMFLCGATAMDGKGYSVGYYMFGVFMLVLVLLMFIEKRMVCRMQGVRTAAMLAVCAAFLLESLSFAHSHMSREQSAYGEAAEWLVENGYTKGYATFWNANIVTELSDGEIETVALGITDGGMTPYRWLEAEESFSMDAPEEPVFLLLGVWEEDGLDGFLLRCQATRVVLDGWINLYEIPSQRLLFEAMDAV